MVQTGEKISEFMKQYIGYSEQIAKLEKEQHFIREIVRSFMHEGNQRRINDAENIAMISVFEKISLDKAKVKKLLNPEQYSSVVKITKVETLKIMSNNTYENIKKMLKTKGDENGSV